MYWYDVDLYNVYWIQVQHASLPTIPRAEVLHKGGAGGEGTPSHHQGLQFIGCIYLVSISDIASVSDPNWFYSDSDHLTRIRIQFRTQPFSLPCLKFLNDNYFYYNR